MYAKEHRVLVSHFSCESYMDGNQEGGEGGGVQAGCVTVVGKRYGTALPERRKFDNSNLNSTTSMVKNCLSMTLNSSREKSPEYEAHAILVNGTS